MKIIEVTSDRREVMQTHAGKALAHIRKLMEEISDIEYEECEETDSDDDDSKSSDREHTHRKGRYI